jgi:hypothetical protein
MIHPWVNKRNCRTLSQIVWIGSVNIFTGMTSPGDLTLTGAHNGSGCVAPLRGGLQNDTMIRCSPLFS